MCDISDMVNIDYSVVGKLSVFKESAMNGTDVFFLIGVR
jgi:hypothetical protein